MTLAVTTLKISPAVALLALSCILGSSASAEPLALHNDRIFIGARVNGARTEALLDSAAEGTLIDPQFAASAGLTQGKPITIRGSGGTALAQLVEGAQIEALGVVLHPEVIVVTDLRDISRRLVKRRVEMVLGRELFDAARLSIDFRKKAIDVLPASVSPVGTELTLTEHAGNESVPVLVNGVSAQAEFDLGNGTDVLISKAFARKLRLKPNGSSVGGGIGGALRRDTVEIDELEVAGKTFRHIRAAVDEQSSANDLNIGTKILRHFRITTDFAKRRVWLKPY